MIDPETVRQAAADAISDWQKARVFIWDTEAGDALAGLVPQLLDQLADDAALDRRLAARDALGERCHQLETALRALEVLDNAYLIHHANVVRETARAALGDTPPPEPRTTDRPSQESLDRLAQREREEPTIRTLNTGPDVLIEDERGDAAVSPEPSYSVPMTATGAAAVEPPQPSPTDETCHHGRPFDLCAICSARIPYERPPQPETPA